MTSVSASRYVNIDGLRAIAAFGVILEHAAGDIVRASSDGAGPFRAVLVTMQDMFSPGRFGVALFFLISGFVVPFSLRGPRPFTHFVISRFFRLYPALWLALFAIALGLSLDGHPPRAVTMLGNMSMMPMLLHQHWLSQTYWTLSIELMFYASAVALFAAGCVRRPAVITCVAIGLLMSTCIPVLLRTLDLAALRVEYMGFHVSLLFLGLLFRLAMVEKVAGAWPCACAVMVTQLVTLSTAADYSLARGDGFVLDGLGPVLSAYAVAITTFIVSIRLDQPRSASLSWLGMISYSLYLFHGIVSQTVYRVLPLTGQIRDLVTVLLCMALTIIVSAIVYRIVEQPMIRFGRDLIAKCRWAAS